MNIKSILNSIVIFVTMYAGLLALITITQDVVSPILKSRKVNSDSRIASPVYSASDNPSQIYSDIARAKNTYVPFIGWRHKPFKSKTVNIDAQGNRIHTPNPQNKNNAPQVGFFGGSAMWGVGVTNEQTIPAQFDAKTTEFKVTNFAERGYTSRQSLALLINLINRGKMPEVVIFNDGFADIWTLCNDAVTTLRNGHIQERKITATLYEAKEIGTFFKSFISPLFNLAIKIRGKKKWPPLLACSKSPERADAIASTLVKNWQIANTLVKANGGTFYAILQPNAYTSKIDTAYLQLQKGKKSKAMGKEMTLVYPLIRSKLSQAKSLSYFDYTSIYDEVKKPVFIDAAHISAYGNDLQAQKIANMLSKLTPPTN